MFLNRFINRPTLSSVEDFAALRKEVANFGVENFKNVLVASGILNDNYKIPFDSSFFARELSKSEDTHMIFPNIKWKDELWFTEDKKYLGRASMSKTHKLLVINNFDYENFNVLMLAIENIENIENNRKIKERALETINEIERLSYSYCDFLEIKNEDMGLYFHCYPTNSVHITHVHILDKSFLSPSFYVNYWKNLPLDAVRTVIHQELKSL